MRIPWLFSRYLAKRFLLTFLAVLFVLSALILLFDVIDLLRRAASKEYVSFLDVVRLGLFKVPQTLPLILPFTILIASVITFLLLSKTHELVIARSAGLSVWNFLTPIFIAVSLIGVINITLINPFATAMIRRYQFEEEETMHRKAGFSWNEKGLWLREKMGDTPVIIHADSVHQDGKDLKLNGVLVLGLNEDETLKRQTEAPNGLLSGYTLVINDGVSYTPEGVREEGIQMHIPTQLDLEKIIQEDVAIPTANGTWYLGTTCYSITEEDISQIINNLVESMVFSDETIAISSQFTYGLEKCYKNISKRLKKQ